MKTKRFAGGAFLLNTFLYGSYYAISKEVLGHVDPIVFSFCEMMTLVPPALVILVWSWRHMTRQAVKSGFVLGSCLCLGLFMLSISLRYNSATGTAFFPALNGLLAALFAWLFLRQPITKTTWFAGIVSVTGAVLLMANADMGGIRGSLIAFLGGLFCTLYIFLVDHEQKNQTAYWPLFAIELLTMALWGNLVALLFGDWNLVHFVLPKDALVILYIGLGTVFLPTLITVLLQKYISPVTVSFITILEPILSAIVAYLYLREVLPFDGYLGGGLVVAGVFIHTWGTREKVRTGPTLTQPALRESQYPATERNNGARPAPPLVPASATAAQSMTPKLSPAFASGARFHTSGIALLLFPLLCTGIGMYIVSHLGGFPPPVWRDLLQSIPQFPTMVQHGQAMDICIMIALSLSWLIAWGSLLLMGGIATYSALEKLFRAVDQRWIGTSPIPTQTAQEAIARASYAQSHTLQYPTLDRRHAENLTTSPTSPDVHNSNGTSPNLTEGSASEQAPQIDARLLRQMGYTPYSVSTRPAKRKLDTIQLQQRRLQRRIRLAHVESPKVTGPLPDTLLPIIEKQEIDNDTHGNTYLYWDEFSRVGKGLIPFQKD